MPSAVVVLLVAAGLVTAFLRERTAREASRPASGEFVAGYDTRIFVQRAGNPHAPAVVFVAGTGGWSGLWTLSMAHAVDLGYQAIAIDMPPFGYSYPVPSGNYSKREQGRRLLAALDAMGLNQITVVAHSIGAAPVMEAVFSAPARFHALVLIDPALGLDGPQTDGADTTLQAALRHSLLARPVCAILTNPLLTSRLLQRVISEKDRATPDWVRIYQRPLNLRGASAAIAQWLPEVLAARGHAMSDDPGAYSHLEIPVTLIWGATDAITPLAQGMHLERLIPRAKLVIIPRAGHGPQFEEPELFNAALRGALGWADRPGDRPP
ncbi:MAG TPA: alpha/beta hydrolase [Steroidobacteraceae bacterium]|nr:alpha/beta hydrolase [Steroidobacteraceae bacterium]